MSPELLVRSDVFRELLGYPVIASPAEGAIGRHARESTSGHNIDRYLEVQATDFMPEIIEPEKWIWAAKKAGFRGIGIYPHWKPKPGIHLDVKEGPFRTWGAIRPDRSKPQVYVSLDEALKWFSHG
jgi:hypothetical protein